MEPDSLNLQDGYKKLNRGHQEMQRQLGVIQAEQQRVHLDLKATAEGLRENTEATKRIEKNTAGLVETFEALSGGFRVLAWIGKAAVPIAIIWGGVKAYTIGLFAGFK